MSNLGGFMGKILRVNLSTGRLWDEVVDEITLRRYLGGTGLGVKIVYDEVPPGVEWDSPENRLVVSAGPLSGTRIPGSGTYNVVTKGAMVNGMACAQTNGFFAARMKFAGYDAVVVQGIATRWSYVYLHDGAAELRDASHLVGLDTFETEDALKDETGDKQTSVACVGPAGENKVRFSGVCSDKGHIASSGGVGAVMAVKRLKAIVAHGKAKPRISDETEYKRQVKEWTDGALEWPLAKRVSAIGTYGSGGHGALVGVLAVRNWTGTRFPEADLYGAEIQRPLYNAKPRPCWACRLAHCQEYHIPDGKYAGLTAEEPEGEGRAAWSSLTGIADPTATIYLCQLCDKLGIDLKEAGFTVSLAQECYSKGLLTKEQTDGLELSWGNVDAISSLLHKIARREGWIGNVLAEGAMRAAQAIGGDAPMFAVHFGKGNAPHVHDTRAMAHLLYTQSVSDTSSYTSNGLPYDPDMGYNEPIAPFDPDVLVRYTAETSARRQFEECLGVCHFLWGARLDTMAATVSAVTGFSMNKSQCLEVGERIMNLMRAFNLRHGKTPADDTISPRMQEGPQEGVKWISIAPHIEKMNKDYYKAMGWDEATSKPLPDTLKRLGLENVIKDLWAE